MGENKRILYLDYARVFTALLVIYGHLYTPSDSNLVRILIYQFHMPLFFIISGMLHKCTGAIQWKKYFRTIVIPTTFFAFLYAIITFPLYKWAGWFGFKESVPESLFYGVSTMRSVINYLKYYAIAIVHGTNMLNGPCWFLIALLWCKIFTDFFNKTTTTKIVATIIWVLAFMCVIKFHKKAFFLGQATIAIPYYILGHISKDKINEILSSKAKTPLLIFSIILLSSCVYLNNKTSLYAIGFGRMPFPVNVLFFYVAGIAGSFVIIYLSSLIKKDTFISRTSKALISILGLQMIFVFLIDNTIGYDLNYFISIPIAIAIYILCVFSHNMVERTMPFIYGKSFNLHIVQCLRCR